MDEHRIQTLLVSLFTQHSAQWQEAGSAPPTSIRTGSFWPHLCSWTSCQMLSGKTRCCGRGASQVCLPPCPTVLLSRTSTARQRTALTTVRCVYVQVRDVSWLCSGAPKRCRTGGVVYQHRALRRQRRFVRACTVESAASSTLLSPTLCDWRAARRAVRTLQRLAHLCGGPRSAPADNRAYLRPRASALLAFCRLVRALWRSRGARNALMTVTLRICRASSQLSSTTLRWLRDAAHARPS